MAGALLALGPVETRNPTIKVWLRRQHREINHNLIQFLSGMEDIVSTSIGLIRQFLQLSRLPRSLRRPRARIPLLFEIHGREEDTGKCGEEDVSIAGRLGCD